ncbi:MAG: tetratricopeptide repeat protein, partial [Candidatus Aegiribacteria sp.]|nr:tetratricopeptide repeat protein [Candidatus Aegiribacteria sp.]MBD3295057.1 tetratricopeptide repeat protein [Candidatus Fermentibacteria bacterium]
LVQSRMDMLPGEDRMLLQIASVIGESFRMAVLERVVSKLKPETDVGKAAARLESLGFLRVDPGETVSFRHDLLQSSVYSTVLKHNRKTIHAQAAEAVMSLYPDEEQTLAPVIFTHWDRTDRRKMKLHWVQKAMDSALNYQQNSEIMRLADKMLKLADRDDYDDWRVRMNALGARETVFARRGNLDRAMKLLDRMITESRDRGVPVVEVGALRSKSILLKEKGMMKEAEALLEMALEKVDRTEDVTQKGQIFGTIGVLFADTGKLDKARKYYRKALKIFQDSSQSRMVAAIRSNMANLHLMTGNRREAVEEFKAAMGICTQAGLRNSLGYALNGYAIAMAQMNDLDAASRLFQEALEIERDIGNLPLQSSILSNLGILTKLQGDYRTSLEYRLASLDLARKSNNRHTECISLVNAGNMYRLMGRLEEAEDNTRLGLEIAEKINDMRTVCHGLSVLGMVYLQKSETQRAMEQYRKVRDLADKADIGPGIVDDLDDLIRMLDERNIDHEKPLGWREEGGDDS